MLGVVFRGDDVDISYSAAVLRDWDLWLSMLYNLRSGSWLMWANGTEWTLLQLAVTTVKWYSSPEQVVFEPRGVSCHIWSHSVTCHSMQVNTLRHNLSQTGWYSINLSRRNGRLSWPRWMITDRYDLPVNRQLVTHPSSNCAQCKRLCWCNLHVTTAPCSHQHPSQLYGAFT